MKLDIDALILCGGKGSRLGKLGKKLPKSLVKIDKNPILKDIIHLLPSQICTNIIISGYYMIGKIKSYIDKSNFSNIILYNDGDIEILERIKLNLIRQKKPLVVCYGDELADINFKKLIKSHIKSKKLVTITTLKQYSNFGFLRNKDNKYYFEEKPFLGNSNIGFMIFDIKNIKYINNTKRLDNYINKLCNINEINEYKHNGYHATFNSVDELAEARKSIKKL